MNAARTERARARPWLVGLLLALCLGPAHALPSYDAVRGGWRPSDTLLLSREGEVLQRLRTDATVRKGTWVVLADTSPALRSALLLSEDKRFYAHSGVDWQAASAAAWANLWNRRTRGASTITMQLAGLLDDGAGVDLRQRPGGRSVVQKAGQVAAAQVLDRRWRKDQILEAYLNLVPFRGELVGIDALSRSLFGKAPQGLDAREAALAAALVRAPNASAAQVARRACAVLQEMQAAGSTGAAASAHDCDAMEMLASGTLARRSWAPSEGLAPHFARRALAAAREAAPGQAVPARIATTLRAPLQRFAVQTLAQQLRELSGRNVQDGAIVVLDNATGEVLAWVGSSGALSEAGEVDGVLARRQPGSTLKPFLLAQALAERRLTAASLIDDSPAHIPTAAGLYVPQNYDGRFKGWVSARTALGASLNVPTVRMLTMVSPDAFFQQLQALGLELRESGGYYGLSLALGSSEVGLLQLSNAYRALANGGRAGPVAPPLLRPGATARPAPAGRAALDPRAAFIVGDILSDPMARARTFGTDSVLATRRWSAVKTGTSKDMRDNWAVGWTERYTVGVWVGNAAGGAMHDVSGTTGAAPIWAAVVGFLHAQEPSRAPKPPPGLVRQAVRFGPAVSGGDPLEAARSEWFLAGTEQTLFAIDSIAADADPISARAEKSQKIEGAAAPAALRIAAPAEGAVVALDPDIPPANQRLRFVAAGVHAGAVLRWHLDGAEVGRGAAHAWMPWPGRHALELQDAQGRVIDRVRFEVRGAGVRVPPAARGPRKP